jgi:hypothetical protein
MSAVAYRCPFCGSQKPPAIKMVRTPLGKVLSLSVGISGLVGMIIALVVAVVNQASAGVVLLLILLFTALWLGAWIGIEKVARESRQVCPDCKVRVS